MSTELSADMQERQNWRMDVEQVFRSKLPKMSRLMPGFVFNVLRRIVREKEINALYVNNCDKDGAAFLEGVVSDMNIDLQIVGREHIPAQGHFVLVANHPLGGADAMAFVCVGKSLFPKVRIISNELFMLVPTLRSVVLGADVFGRANREQIAAIDAVYADQTTQMLTFPAGRVSRKHKEGIRDDVWQKSFVTKAIANQRDVIPVYVHGYNSKLFYNLARWRKRLGIGLNLELFLLPSEMMKQRNQKIIYHIGQPIRYSELRREVSGLSPSQWAEKIKEMVYEIGKSYEADR